MNKKTVVISLLSLLTLVSIAALAISIIAVVQINKTESEDLVFDFPEDFEFGAATSAYQIEGGWDAHGKGRNIWDNAVHNHPEIILDRRNGDEAADSYNLYREDVEALKASNFSYYRFSISWSRILPEGMKPNEPGINYYNYLINELISNGIKPMITMYHWDLPEYVQAVGGWTNPIVVDYFEQYANLIYERFGDRVKTFITFNEPYIFCERGYGRGIFPPLVRSPGLGEYMCGHHVLLAHARSYHLYQEKYAATQKGEVGICLYSEFYWPTNGTDAKLADNAVNHILGWYANPIYSKDGNYPQVMIDNIKRNSGNRPWSRLPEFTSEEIQYIKGTADFLALNYYTSRLVKPKVSYPAEYDWEADAGIDKVIDPSWKSGKSDWLYSVPEGLHDLLVWIKDRYDNPKLFIAENGYSDDGEIEDDDRITYTKDHLMAIKKAMEAGCKITSYTAWSLIDNFEWLAGYTERFGLYYVDFDTKRRIPKKSSKYFKELITTRKI